MAMLAEFEGVRREGVASPMCGGGGCVGFMILGSCMKCGGGVGMRG